MNPVQLLNRLLDSSLWSLILKEIHQILRDKQLLFLLLFPPTVQLLIFGFALDPQVQLIELGVVDYAHTLESRQLVNNLTANDLFVVERYFLDASHLAEQVSTGNLTVGLVIPPEFNRDLEQGKTAEVQVFIDGVDANTAGIASGYITQILNQYNRELNVQATPPLVQTQTIFFYNPGLLSSWFLVPGVIGVVMTLTGVLVSSATIIREKDSGTLEQLLMTPAQTWEILLAKILPLFILLMGDVLLALAITLIVFRLPLAGSLILFLALSGLYVFVGIGIGMMLSTLARSQQQVVLSAFFVNLPMIILSGAIAPIESMPPALQYLSLLDPLRHFVTIARGLLLKGNGLEVLWGNALALALFALGLLSISTNRFRSQLN